MAMYRFTPEDHLLIKAAIAAEMRYVVITPTWKVRMAAPELPIQADVLGVSFECPDTSANGHHIVYAIEDLKYEEMIP